MLWDIANEAGDGEALGRMAQRLGWAGLGVLAPPERLKEAKRAAATAVGVVLSGLRPAKVADAARAVRRSAELIAVRGGDLEVNRAAVECAEVDLLLQPWGASGERSDSGFNHVLAALAARNGVRVVFTLSELASAQRRQRAALFGSFLEVAERVRKAKAPFALASGATEAWELRGPEELKALGRVLRLPEAGIREALSGRLVAENRKRLAGKWVGPGVELE